VTHQFLTASPYRIHAVLHGKTPSPPDTDGSDPYAAAKSLNLYKEVETEFSGLTAHSIIDRIIGRRQVYEERNRKKEAKEVAELERTKSGKV
jgi:ethanolamine-phosphate cytidylyltransferase